MLFPSSVESSAQSKPLANSGVPEKGKQTAVLHRDIRIIPKQAIGAEGSYIFLEDGQRVLDATGGAAVSCLGHGNEQVNRAIVSQINQISYCYSAFFSNKSFEDLASYLAESTGGKLSKLYIISSGMHRIDAFQIAAGSITMEVTSK
jgi:adenosylmethionine-8-amino-7-oxononanoate aminotransferase